MKWQMWRTSQGSPEAPDSGATIAVREAYERSKSTRAEVIDGATYVERILEAVLCDAIVGKDPIHRERLSSTMFSGESHTLFQKWKSLRLLLNQDPNWLGHQVPDASSNLKLLHRAIGDRNAFAHGELSVASDTLEVSLHYFEGTEQDLILSGSAVTEILERMSQAYFWLEGLHLDFYGHKLGSEGTDK